MLWLVAVLGLSVLAVIAAGIFLEWRPRRLPATWLKGGLLANLAVFALALVGLLFMGMGEVMAEGPQAGLADVSVGMGLVFIGIGLPTGLAAIAAAMALGPVGSASLAVIAEKPELFGRTLIYMGLAEGVAIYGLVMSILMLGKLG